MPVTTGWLDDSQAGRAAAAGMLVVLSAALGCLVVWPPARTPLLLGLAVIPVLALAHRPSLGIWFVFLSFPVAAAFGTGHLASALVTGLPACVVASWLVHALVTGRRVRLLPAALTAWFVAFLLWTLVACAGSADPAISLRQLAHYFLLFLTLLTVRNLWTPSEFRRAAVTFAVFMAAVALISIHQATRTGLAGVLHAQVVGPERISSFYFNANILGLWLGNAVVVLVPLAIRRFSGRWSLRQGLINTGLGLVILVLAAALVLTFSRGAYVYVSISVLVVALMHRRLRWVVGGLLGGAAAILLLSPVPSWLYTALRLQSGSTYRFQLWSAGFQVMQDHPWIGLGPGTPIFNVFRNQYLASAGRKGLAYSPGGGAHNVFLNKGAEMGWPGLVLTILVFVLFLIPVGRGLRRYAQGDWFSGAAAACILGLTARSMVEISGTVGEGTVTDSLLFFLFGMILLGWGRSQSAPFASSNSS